MNVVVNDRELLERNNVIRQFLRPIAKRRDVGCNSVSVGLARVIAAHDGSQMARQYRDWRFRSACRDIHCQYFEVWDVLKSGREWALNRAYLHVFLINRESRQEQELIAVHADPNNTDALPLQAIRKAPHLHVTSFEPWLQHTHFSLTVGYVDRAVRSVSEFTRVFSEAVKVVRSEVINRAPA
jgi:hypothetical protein